MRYRLLGQTGLYVSELCLGTMTYGGGKGIWESIGNLQQDAVNEQVKFAVDKGINFIDTANVYSTGMSETLLGQSLAKPFVTTVIIGAKSMDQLRDNIDSTRVQLDGAEERQLDEISAIPAEYPGWMLAFQGQARAKAPVKE